MRQDVSCTSNGTKVQGTLEVARNATLIASGVGVIGDVQGNKEDQCAGL